MDCLSDIREDTSTCDLPNGYIYIHLAIYIYIHKTPGGKIGALYVQKVFHISQLFAPAFLLLSQFNVNTGKCCQADLPWLFQGFVSCNFDVICFMIHVLFKYVPRWTK